MPISSKEQFVKCISSPIHSMKICIVTYSNVGIPVVSNIFVHFFDGDAP